MPEFKQQLVDLYRSGKRKCDIVREYDIAKSLLDKWIAQADNLGSFKEKDNRIPKQQELIELRKQNQHLKMENNILKFVITITAKIIYLFGLLCKAMITEKINKKSV